MQTPGDHTAIQLERKMCSALRDEHTLAWEVQTNPGIAKKLPYEDAGMNGY